jgi:hypothetical protein
MLDTIGDFTAKELKPDLNGCVCKEVPRLEDARAGFCPNLGRADKFGTQTQSLEEVWNQKSI